MASYVSATSISAIGSAWCILSAAVVTGPELNPTICDRCWETADEIIRRVLSVSNWVYKISIFELWVKLVIDLTSIVKCLARLENTLRHDYLVEGFAAAAIV